MPEIEGRNRDGHAFDNKYTESFHGILEILCSESGLERKSRDVLDELCGALGSDAAAIRLYDGRDDFPYYAHVGFDENFIEKESLLCGRTESGRLSRKEDGSCVLECLCGKVLSGNPAGECTNSTEFGSLWVDSTSDKEEIKNISVKCDDFRGSCGRFGYESLALVPLHPGDNGIIGLLQLNSREKSCFSRGDVEFLEHVSGYVSTTVQNAWLRRKLSAIMQEFEHKLQGMESMIAMGAVSATLAHELRNPLGGMLLSATRLQRQLGKMENGEKLAGIAGNLCDSIRAMSDTVDGIFSSVKEPKIAWEDVEVNEAVETAVNLVSERAAHQGVRILRNYSENLPQVRANPNFLMRAFLNIIVNALDEMPEGGTLELETGVNTDGSVFAAIRDTGRGIDIDDVRLLYKPFYTTKKDGTGMGLSIVNRILDMHSAELEFINRDTGGAEAVVGFPAETKNENSNN